MIRALILFLCTLSLPAIALAQADIELFQSNIPFLGDASNLTIEQYVNALYQAAIGIAAILVVYKLIVAGVKYMFSEVVTQKGEAIKDIRGALIGILIVLGAVTILNTINPNLTRLNFLESADQVVATADDVVIRYTVNTYAIYEDCDAIVGTERASCIRENENNCAAEAERRGLELQIEGNRCVQRIQHYTTLFRYPYTAADEHKLRAGSPLFEPGEWWVECNSQGGTLITSAGIAVCRRPN